MVERLHEIETAFEAADLERRRAERMWDRIPDVLACGRVHGERLRLRITQLRAGQCEQERAVDAICRVSAHIPVALVVEEDAGGFRCLGASRVGDGERVGLVGLECLFGEWLAGGGLAVSPFTIS